MTRGFCHASFAAVAVVLSLSPMSFMAVAQTGGGGGQFGGPPGPGKYGPPRVSSGSGFGAGSQLQLVTLPEVQKALKLSAKQKRGIAKINQEMIDGRRRLFQAGVGGIGGGIQRLGDEAADKLAELLDDEQEKRLRGITIQISGANAVMIDAVLAKELKITDEQKSKLQEIQQANMQEMSKNFQVSGIPPESSRARFEELHANGQKKLHAVLTTEQQKQLDALQGDKIEIDLMKLPGGGSGDRRRGGGVGRVPGDART